MVDVRRALAKSSEIGIKNIALEKPVLEALSVEVLAWTVRIVEYWKCNPRTHRMDADVVWPGVGMAREGDLLRPTWSKSRPCRPSFKR